MRRNLLDWQWRGYREFHQRPTTLWVHAVTVPLFNVATVWLLAGLPYFTWFTAIGCVLVMLSCLIAQAIAHRSEPATRVPFRDPIDFVTRLLVEQFFTFPRFWYTGGWGRALRNEVREE